MTFGEMREILASLMKDKEEGRISQQQFENAVGQLQVSHGGVTWAFRACNLCWVYFDTSEGVWVEWREGDPLPEGTQKALNSGVEPFTVWKGVKFSWGVFTIASWVIMLFVMGVNLMFKFLLWKEE